MGLMRTIASWVALVSCAGLGFHSLLGDLLARAIEPDRRDEMRVAVLVRRKVPRERFISPLELHLNESRELGREADKLSEELDKLLGIPTPPPMPEPELPVEPSVDEALDTALASGCDAYDALFAREREENGRIEKMIASRTAARDRCQDLEEKLRISKELPPLIRRSARLTDLYLAVFRRVDVVDIPASNRCCPTRFLIWWASLSIFSPATVFLISLCGARYYYETHLHSLESLRTARDYGDIKQWGYVTGVLALYALAPAYIVRMVLHDGLCDVTPAINGCVGRLPPEAGRFVAYIWRSR